MINEDFEWMIAHGAELSEKYGGKWIAVRGCEVVAEGDTATEATERVLTKVEDGEFILECVDTEADIYGNL